MASHTPAFFGRINELQFLKDHWELAKQGKPQIVNIIADTGVGKTRLVHEFYHWLASESFSSDDDYGYWPKNLGVGRQRVVNPPLDLFKSFDTKKDTIPWLWWGMYWTDADGENECTLIRSHEYIQAHVDMLSIDKRFKASTSQAIMEWVKEEGLSHVVEWIPGGSQILNLGGLFKKIRKSKKEKLAMESGIGEQSKNRLESLASDLIRDFSDVLSVKKTGGDVVPMVVFLDDIQFATDYSHDAFALEFLERLLNQSVSEGWPLMVIATHWRAEWLEHSQPKQEINFKPWRHVVDGVSGKIHASELKLEKIPVADLRNIMLDILPGLDRDVQERILGRVDNVRWLVEILNALRDDVENFLNGDRTKSLSDFGVDITLSSLLKHGGYLDVIRHRLTNDSMRELRHILGAMAWNTPGLSFISELAKGFGQELMKHGILQSEGESPEQRVMYLLIQAIDPGSLVDGLLINNDIPSTISFPERGYLEVAKELFHTDRLHAMRIGLGNEVIDWLSDVDESGDARWQKLPSNSDRKIFLEIAYNVLGQLKPQLSDEQINELSVIEKTLRKQLEKGKIEEQDYHDQLNEAKEDLLSEGLGAVEKSDYWQVVAGVELVAMLHDEGQGRAYELAYELAENQFVDNAFDSVEKNSIITIAMIWSEKEEYLSKSYALLKSVVLESNDKLQSSINSLDNDQILSGRLMWELIYAYSKVVDIELRIGDYKKARESIRIVLGTVSYLISDVSGLWLFNTEFLMKANLADIDFKEGKFSEARLAYQECLDLAKVMINKFGYSRDTLANLSFAQSKLAEIDYFENSYESARAGYKACLEIDERIVSEFSAYSEDFRNIAITKTKLGEIARYTGDDDEASYFYKQSLNVHNQLLSDFDVTPERLRDLFLIKMKLAELDQIVNNIADSASGYKSSLDVAVRILNDYGVNKDRLFDLSLAQFKLSEVDQVAKHYESARLGYERYIEICKSLIDSYGLELERIRDLQIAYLRLGAISEDIEVAQKNYSSAIELGEILIRNDFITSDILRDLASANFNLANIVNEANELEMAHIGYERCLELHEYSLIRYGISPDVLASLIITHCKLLDLDFVGNDINAARKRLEEGLDVADRFKQITGSSHPAEDILIEFKRNFFP